MAEESGHLLVISERTKVNEGNPRRSSMGNASYLNSGEKVFPRYLRASTGSCHDICKYGRKHASEAKERRPLLKRITKSTPDKQSPTGTVMAPERNKTSVRRSDPSSISKSSFDIPESEIMMWEVSTKSPDDQNVKASLVAQISVKGEVQSRMKKTSTAKLRTCPKSKACESESPKFRTQEVSSISEKVNASLRKVSSKSEETNASAKSAASVNLKYPIMKPLPSPDHPGGLSSRRNSDINSEKKMGHRKIAVKQASTSRSLSLASPRPSLSPEPSVIGVARLNSIRLKSLQVVPPRKNQGKVKNAETKQSKNELKQADNDSVRESMKLKSPVMKSLLSPHHSGGSSSRRNSDINARKKNGHPKIAVKQAPTSSRLPLAFPKASLSPRPSIVRVASLNSRKLKSLKVLSPLKNQGKFKNAETEQSKNGLKQANNDSVHERTLYVIKMETENKSLESDQNASCAIESSPSPSSLIPKCIPTSPSSSSLQNEEDQEQSECTETEADDDYLSESEHEESMTMEGEESLGGECCGKPKKGGMVHSEDKDSQAMKLHFRRGKIVDIQSESNGSRRLKFRRGRVLGQNQNPKSDGRRSFKKRGVDDEMNDGKPGSEKVVLRHQDMQGKKDSQVLFNNVIEQTASKLVETRKSKVKALVGAFETVISLQESKPSANIVT